MKIQKGVGEPLRIYGFIGIYIRYMIVLVAITFVLVGFLNVFSVPLLFIILIPSVFLAVGVMYLKNLQKKYGHKGRFIVRAVPRSKIIVKRNQGDFFKGLVKD